MFYHQIELEDEVEAEKRLSDNLMKDPLMAAQKDWVYKEAKLESEVQQVTSKLSSTKAKVSSL